MSDIVTLVSQTTADKILDGADYPLRLFSHRDPREASLLADHDYHEFSVDEILDCTREAGADSAVPITALDENETSAREVRSKIAEAEERFVAEIEASILPATHAEYDPDVAREMRELASRGFQGLFGIRDPRPDMVQVELIRPNARVHLRRVDLDIKNRPDFKLGVPKSFVVGANLRLSVAASIEVYVPIPRFDFPWKWKYGWKHLTSVTLRPSFIASGHVRVGTDGHLVKARGVVDRLVLDFPILRKINLAPWVNDRLSRVARVVYDSRELMMALPLIDSRYRVASVALPENEGVAVIGVSVAKSQESIMGSLGFEHVMESIGAVSASSIVEDGIFIKGRDPKDRSDDRPRS